MGATIGVARRMASLRRGQTNKVQNRDFGWHSDIEAACAEIALAKVLGVYWGGGVNTFHDADAGLFQVRHTQLENGCLIVREADSDYERFVLVRGTHPTYEIPGWLLGADAKTERFARAPGGHMPAWFVPATELRPVSELLDDAAGALAEQQISVLT